MEQHPNFITGAMHYALQLLNHLIGLVNAECCNSGTFDLRMG